MSTNGTVSELFDKAIALEICAEEFYRRLAGMFSSEADVVKFWNRIADEERGHAKYLRQVREKLSTEVLAGPADESMLEMARKSLTQADDGFPFVKNLDDAYNLAIELENSETNTIFQFMLVNFPTEELSKSQAFLSVQLKKHAFAIQNDIPTRYKSKLMRQELLASA
jgi:hypothetical protein